MRIPWILDGLFLGGFNRNKWEIKVFYFFPKWFSWINVFCGFPWMVPMGKQSKINALCEMIGKGNKSVVPMGSKLGKSCGAGHLA